MVKIQNIVVFMGNTKQRNSATDSTLCSWPKEYVELVLEVVVEGEHSALPESEGLKKLTLNESFS